MFFTSRIDALLQALKLAANDFMAKYDTLDDCTVLKAALDSVIVARDSLVAFWGDELNKVSELGRHIYFCEHFLGENYKEGCGNDPHTIVAHDIPAIEGHIRKSLFSHQEVSAKLSDQVMPLIGIGRYDSAIQKTFLTLTETLRAYDPDLIAEDGETLVNKIFAKSTTIRHGFNDDEAASLRNLLAGLYGFYRNKWFHHQGDCSIHELEGILSVINDILIKVEDARLGAPVKL